MTKNSPLCTWDFTCPDESFELCELKEILKSNCKKWSFQKEKGNKSGYVHYQGRFSLKMKKRKPQVIELFGGTECKVSFTPTSNENRNNMFYVEKDETRIDGPWSDKDEEIYIPRQFEGKIKNLYPFQQEIWDSYDEFNDRNINCIICDRGNVGKSMISSLCDLYGRGYDIPAINDPEKLIQAVCNILMAKKDRNPGIFFIDIPRSMKQDKLFGLFNAIEQIKKGKVYDTRYKYTEWWFDSPQIWVFMNTCPNMSYLSMDRWNLYEISKKLSLIKYNDGIDEVDDIKELYF